MKTPNKQNLDDLVAETLNTDSDIRTVKAPPFFKDKVLHRMHVQNTEETTVVGLISWFTPRYQLVALICFVVLNSVALLSYTPDSYVENVANFSEVYGLSEKSTDSYLFEN